MDTKQEQVHEQRGRNRTIEQKDKELAVSSVSVPNSPSWCCVTWGRLRSSLRLQLAETLAVVNLLGRSTNRTIEQSNSERSNKRQRNSPPVKQSKASSCKNMKNPGCHKPSRVGRSTNRTIEQTDAVSCILLSVHLWCGNKRRAVPSELEKGWEVL